MRPEPRAESRRLPYPAPDVLAFSGRRLQSPSRSRTLTALTNIVVMSPFKKVLQRFPEQNLEIAICFLIHRSKEVEPLRALQMLPEDVLALDMRHFLREFLYHDQV